VTIPPQQIFLKLTYIKFNNQSKIIIIPSEGQERLRGFTGKYFFWDDEKIVDFPPKES
jgi:hypothetical protein